VPEEAKSETIEDIEEEESGDISDELDIDSLIADVQGEEDATLDIGDDLLGSVDEPSLADDETLEALDSDFDESTLSELLSDEKALDSAVELSPDFTDSNVLADLLADGASDKEEVSEATEIDDIQELDSLDFDELLANIEEESTTNSDEDSFDFTDEIDIGDELIESPSATEDSNVSEEKSKPSNEDHFVSVDSLLSDSLDPLPSGEPYEQTNIDVGLGEFPEFTEGENDIDVDDDNGVAAKLDLAKVYLEIGDKENAEIILQDVVSMGDAQQQFDAQQLLDNLK